jgi:hypothetical protein
MYGGLTGFGHPSLGGLLLGGAKSQKLTQHERDLKKISQMAQRRLAGDNLSQHIMAEQWAQRQAQRAGLADYAGYLDRDLIQEQKIRARKHMPMWAANEYTYNTLYQPRVKRVLSPAEKLRMRNMAKHKKYMREMSGESKILNPETGRMVWASSKAGQRILNSTPNDFQYAVRPASVDSPSSYIGLSVPQRRSLPSELSAQLRLPRSASVRNPSSGRFISTSDPEFLDVSSSDF